MQVRENIWGVSTVSKKGRCFLHMPVCSFSRKAMDASYLWSILPIFRCDFCLFMYHYFGHWHVRVLLFGLFYCLSQRLTQEEPKREGRKQKGGWNMHDQWQGGY